MIYYKVTTWTEDGDKYSEEFDNRTDAQECLIREIRLHPEVRWEEINTESVANDNWFTRMESQATGN